ncbi:MAG: YdcF family protein [Sulfurospirillaceae bacterium]|nr:YdcF family protein [Sulfurospirillaceae bacterium]MDD2825373.1 YdcF family protein [Sulfurospirillaceae bacterium]
MLLTPLEKPYNVPLHVSSVNAVIVLGGGHTQGSANLPLSDEANKRALWGMMIAKKYNLPLLFSGGGFNPNYSESDAFLDTTKDLATYLSLDMPLSTRLSIKKFSVFIENKSLDTYENAKLSQRLFEEEGITHPTIYLVTSAYHMQRSLTLYEHFGFHVIPAATAFKISTHEKDLWDYLPNIWAFEKSYTALHEYIGLLSLKLKGL